jgi:hypothetical protein
MTKGLEGKIMTQHPNNKVSLSDIRAICNAVEGSNDAYVFSVDTMRDTLAHIDSLELINDKLELKIKWFRETIEILLEDKGINEILAKLSEYSIRAKND